MTAAQMARQSGSDKISSPLKCMSEGELEYVLILIRTRKTTDPCLIAAVNHIGSCEGCSKRFLTVAQYNPPASQ